MPGRFNVSEIDGVQAVLDYGHNTAALTASVLQEGLLLEKVLPSFTRHTPDALKLTTKSRLCEGADGDVVLLGADTLAVTDVIAKGRPVLIGAAPVHLTRLRARTTEQTGA